MNRIPAYAYETSRIELKRELNDDLERKTVAFLNSPEGGVFYFGVDDDGSVFGLDDIDRIQLQITDRLKNNILPNTLGLFDLATENYDDKRVLKLTVSGGPEKPYYLRKYGMSPKGCYIRVGSSAQPMTTVMIENFYAKRVLPKLSAIPSPRQKLTFNTLKLYYDSKGLELNEEFAYSLDLVDENGEYNYAAYLLADQNGVSMKVAKFAGTDKVDLIENEEYGYCCLIKAADRVLEKLTVENKTFAKVTPRFREERKMIDPVALREAFINAVVHNDYSREVPPVVEIYSDRLTITSFGGLPQGLSKENFFNKRLLPRNRELMRVFKDVGMVEHLGSGMSRILAAYDASVFDIEGNFLVVTFPFAEGFLLLNGNEVGNENTEFGNETNDFGNENDDFGNDGNENGNDPIEKVLVLIEENPKIRLDELVTATGISKRSVSREMKKLQEDGVIERIGSPRSGYWKILNKA
jgi:predicted HTH transcriptional regulator